MIFQIRAKVLSSKHSSNVERSIFTLNFTKIPILLDIGPSNTLIGENNTDKKRGVKIAFE